jgi:two-component system, cell cycle sensor histidine kinase and response regulator CckA
MAREIQRTVLVVDDDPRILTVACQILSLAGYRVLAASSPQDAIQKFERAGGAIDLLLSDVLMPEMSGPELSEVLRCQKPSLPVLLMTGYAGKFRGAADLIEKPFGAGELERRVAQTLNTTAAVREM